MQQGPIIGGLSSQLFYFLPKDAAGNYVGPGFGYKFKASTSAGYLQGGIVDLKNGYYVQAVRYAQDGPKPTVTITGTDGCFEKTIGNGGLWRDILHNINVWLVLIILVLLILLLLCLLGKLRRR